MDFLWVFDSAEFGLKNMAKAVIMVSLTWEVNEKSFANVHQHYSVCQKVFLVNNPLIRLKQKAQGIPLRNRRMSLSL
jgi:hypothetical protein